MRTLKSLALTLAALAPVMAATTTPTTPALTPKQVLTELYNGNLRFQRNARTRTIATSGDAALRNKLVPGQSPIAVVITCADSRVDETLIFDQEPGRIFTIREAGNCPDTLGKASAEYAAGHLGTTAIIVMGHGACGAVKAVKEAGATTLPGLLSIFQTRMANLLALNPKSSTETDANYLIRLIKANAQMQAKDLINKSHEIDELVDMGKVGVYSAYYDLATGAVSFYNVQ